MKIIGVIMVYNCGDVVLEALKSLDGLVDEIRCCDSCWIPKFSGIPYSNDDTQSVIEKFAKTSKSKVEYIRLNSPTSEGKARVNALENIVEGDWVFVLDADERVIGWDSNVRSILEGTNEVGFLFYWDGKSIFPTCRFFRRINGMKYFTQNPCFSNDILLDKNHKLGPIAINVHHDTRKRRCPNASGYAQRPHP